MDRPLRSDTSTDADDGTLRPCRYSSRKRASENPGSLANRPTHRSEPMDLFEYQAKLLFAEASDIAEEYYISFLLDRANRTYLAMCSVEGGVEIEEVAATKPER